ncbi:recombinase XerD [Rhodococcus sp. ZPP]|uniref:recombinase XerD n=1 Tax=Rhodococcus sp. ZPP TaxID=2749906 RepID=UPI0032971E2C
MGRIRARWPDGAICGTCFYAAMRTHGSCTICGLERLLPGRLDSHDGPICGLCAGITDDLACSRCGVEAEHYRRSLCARCALRDDVTELLIIDAADPGTMTALVEGLCRDERPESLITWMRPAQMREILRRLAVGDIAMSHEGIDELGHGLRVTHLRGLLEHHGLLPERDAYLARFEHWLRVKFDAIGEAAVRQPVEQFATWHHLRRIRAISATGSSTRGPVHAAKQEITETIKFLDWLLQAHGRVASTCNQRDVDEWLIGGPTTRHNIRTFFVWALRARVNTTILINHRSARSSPTITQDQRIAWLRELLTGNSESLPYRIAGTLLLLYAQPIARIASHRTTDILLAPDGPYLALGTHPAPIPTPFADMLTEHLAQRPNLHAVRDGDSEWLFPGRTPGSHLHPNTIMNRLRTLGIDLLGARTTAIRTLVSEVPAPIVADMLGYSQQITHLHAAETSQPWPRYVRPAQRRQGRASPRSSKSTTTPTSRERRKKQ